MPRRRRTHHLEQRCGFTWVEVLMSILLFAVIISSVSSLLINSMGVVRASKLDNYARMAAVREMERLKAQSWATLAALPITPSSTTFTEGLDEIPGAAGRVYVSNVDANLKQITVAAFVYGTGSARSVHRLVSLVSANELNQ